MSKEKANNASSTNSKLRKQRFDALRVKTKERADTHLSQASLPDKNDGGIIYETSEQNNPTRANEMSFNQTIGRLMSTPQFDREYDHDLGTDGPGMSTVTPTREIEQRSNY